MAAHFSHLIDPVRFPNCPFSNGRFSELQRFHIPIFIGDGVECKSKLDQISIVSIHMVVPPHGSSKNLENYLEVKSKQAKRANALAA